MYKMSYYDILHLKPSATKNDIRRSYRSLALKWHPDRNHSPEAEERFKEINEAYHVLMDSVKRSQYNEARTQKRPWKENFTARQARKQFDEEMLSTALELVMLGVPYDELINCLVYFGVPYSIAKKQAAKIHAMGKEQIEDYCRQINKAGYKSLAFGAAVGILFPLAGIINIGQGIYRLFSSQVTKRKGLNIKLPKAQLRRHKSSGKYQAKCPICSIWHWTGPVFGKNRYICPKCYVIYTTIKNIPIHKVTICPSCSSAVVYSLSNKDAVKCKECGSLIVNI